MGLASLLIAAALASAETPARRLLPATAEGTATVRILTPALIGNGLDAPRPGMTARSVTLHDAAGRPTVIQVYEFE